MNYQINKVGIIGAGTMGGGIAAHLANIGIESVLLDIVTPGLSEEELADSAARNRLVNDLYTRMVKARPANLARRDRADFISVGNVEDDFAELASCDWIIEVIIEQLMPKQELMAKIEEIRKPGSIISSNTSGIPIHQIAEKCSQDFKEHFLGTHFFNPPRYLKLLEVIPTEDTRQEVVEFIKNFGQDVLGKGVVICKDTPNFIGNRFFAIANSFAVNYAFENGYSIEEIDAITGPLVGRPKSATFRLLDLVGLDVMGHVSRNLYDAIPNDKYREILLSKQSEAIVGHLIENKWLGNKTGQGFYKKTYVNGNREFWTFDHQSMDYSAPEKVRFESVGAVRKLEDLENRLPALLEQQEDRAVRYLKDTLYHSLAYAAYVTPDIAYRLIDVDAAMRWGFAHEAGPFELWDILGVSKTVEEMEAAGFEVTGWVKEMLAAGFESFYKDHQYYDFVSKSYQPLPIDEKIVSVEILRKAGCEVKRNASASLLDMGDGVALLEMHTPKINAIDVDFLVMADETLSRLESDFDALVIGNQEQDFSVGANIALTVIAASQGLWDQIEEGVLKGQQLFYRLRHAPKPVVTAPHQRVLGGGVELTFAGWATVADHETYIGLVEVGVGLIPAWGGCKELVRRRINPVMRTSGADVLPDLEAIFDQVATAKVATSAWEGKEMGYLRPEDEVVMNSDQRLELAKQKALNLVASGKLPPEKEKVYAAGRDALAALKLRVQTYAWAGYASEHDEKISRKLAHVMCGGDLSSPSWVDPWHFLDLEREAFMSLVAEPLTQARIAHMLQTGKPLRN